MRVDCGRRLRFQGSPSCRSASLKLSSRNLCFAPVLHGGRAGPALERAVEGADFGVAEQEGDLGQRVVRVFEIFDGEAAARLVYQRAEIDSVFLEPPLQRG